MAKWSRGELGFMWLGVGVALIVVAPIGLDGIWTATAVVLGAIAAVYGGWVAWTGMRKDPSDDAPTDEPGDEPRL